MRRFIAIAMLGLMASCSSGEEVTFKLSQPLGQKSAYTMKNRLKVDMADPDSNQLLNTQMMEFDVSFDTEVTSSQPDGRWTIQSKFNSLELKINGQKQDSLPADLVGKVFSMIMDKDGKVIDVKGTEALPPGMNLKEMMSQMSPTSLLPDTTVRVGDSWPVEMVTPMELAGAKLNRVMRGTATLKEVADGQAVIDLDYSVEMDMLDAGPSHVTMKGTGRGKSRIAYDLERARFTLNKDDLVLESSGEMSAGDRVHKMKSTMTSSVEVALVNR